MKVNENSRLSGFTNIQHIVFFEVSVGIVANTVLLLSRVLIFLLQHRPKPSDLIIGHLAFVHILMLITKSFLAIDIFRYQILQTDNTCKSAIYLNMSTRDLSICTTCLLSVFQAITLSPRSSCLAKFKHKSLHHSLCCFFFFWVLNLIISGRFLISTVANPNGTSLGALLLTTSCSLFPIRSLFKYTFFSLMTFQHVLFIGLMVLSSGYMVVLLCRHKRQSQHLHSTSLSPRASPEQRATQTILLLTSFFLFMYSWECILGFIWSVLWNIDPIYYCVLILVGNVYATVSPLVLISSERRVIRFLTFR